MVKVGDTLPGMKVAVAGAEGPREVDTGELFAGRVVLFAVPGAFTPTCSARHLPGFRENLGALRERGVDRVVCLAVNDPFVLRAWAREQEVGDEVVMVADGSARLTRALGMDQDMSARNFGVRSRRFVLVAQDGVVTHLAVEEPGEFGVSSAESVLAAL